MNTIMPLVVAGIWAVGITVFVMLTILAELEK